MKQTYSIIFILVVLISACEKADKPYVLPAPGNVQQAQVNMGENYDTEVFFRFSDTLESTASLTDWELCFETTPDNNLIRMNGGIQVQVFNTLSTDFNHVYATAGIAWQWDSPDGNPDSVALRNCYNNNLQASEQPVYLIDRGPDALTDRYKKMQMIQADALSYQFRFANPDGSLEKTFTIIKDTAFNNVYFSFNENGKTVKIEPGKNKYDILFTRYRYIYYDLVPILPYSVNGVLINPFNTAVAADSVTAFENINYDFAKTMQFSSKYDAVGYDWKAYNFATSYYEVNPKKCYVLKNQDGIYYKFRFINFYDSQGKKGSPQFEFQRL